MRERNKKYINQIKNFIHCCWNYEYGVDDDDDCCCFVVVIECDDEKDDCYSNCCYSYDYYCCYCWVHCWGWWTDEEALLSQMPVVGLLLQPRPVAVVDDDVKQERMMRSWIWASVFLFEFHPYALQGVLYIFWNHK